MARHLVVANQTATSPELIARLKEVTREGDTVVLLVPATPAQYLLTWHEGGRHKAEEVAVDARARLRSAGFNLEDAFVGDPDPLRAITAELESSNRHYDRVVISTLPQGVSRWLKLDLPHQVERKLGVPVTHIVVHRESRSTAAAGGAEGASEPAADGAGWELRRLGEWRGKAVVTSDGHRFSHISEIMYDPATRRPVWIGATDGRIDITPTMIPAAASTIEGDHLRVDYTWDFLNQQPSATVGEGFSSLTGEAALYDYFDLPFDESSDLRVLRQGQEYPDSLSYPNAA